jgi:hypothetical protein
VPAHGHDSNLEDIMRRLSIVTLLCACGFMLQGSRASADEETRLHAELRGFNEVPATASLGRAHLTLTISADGSTITFALDYANLSGPPGAAHIHFGAKATNGGVSFFFCGGGPANVACPTTTSGSISGTVTAADVVGPAAQGIAAGDLADIVRALRHGVAYANMHTAKFPAGEIRSQVSGGRDDDDD